jgi:hypothetical protein
MDAPSVWIPHLVGIAFVTLTLCVLHEHARNASVAHLWCCLGLDGNGAGFSPCSKILASCERRIGSSEMFVSCSRLTIDRNHGQSIELRSTAIIQVAECVLVPSVLGLGSQYVRGRALPNDFVVMCSLP